MSIRNALRLFALGALVISTVLAQDLSDTVRDQIKQIQQIKKNFTAAQKKMDSETVFGQLKALGQLPSWLAEITDSGTASTARVEIGANPSPALLSYIASIGGTVESASANNDVLVAVVPYAQLGSLAARSDVKRIAATGRMTTNGIAPRLTSLPMFIGSVSTQGYIAHKVNQAISTYGYTGAGVKVGVMSDSSTAARVRALISSGDLPVNTVVLPGQEGPTTGADEGTAMGEIVYDMAPGAQIYFASAFNSEQSFADNIRALAAAGCKVIVDDVSYFDEGAFQDGIVAQAVNDVTAAGVTYFSAAANDGDLSHATSGTWEGDFVQGAAVTTGPIATGGETGFFHNFGTAGTPVLYNTLSATNNRVSLKWSDPLGGSTNDYDIFVTNAAGTSLLAYGASAQDGTQDPFEYIGSTRVVAGTRIYVVLYAGSPRALHLATHRGKLSIATAGATYGHNAGLNTVSTAATAWNSARRGTIAFTGGTSNPTETFSSDGPRRIFFQPDGTPITPGNFLFATSGGTLLAKPDVTAADGVTTRTPGFSPFFGTSAAAPHAAGIAALIVQARPDYTPAQVKAAILNSALPASPARDFGVGIADAKAAVAYALAH